MLATAAMIRRIRIHLIIWISGSSGGLSLTLDRRPGSANLPRDVPDLARQHRPESTGCYVVPFDGFEKLGARLLDGLIGKLESAPMAAGGKSGVGKDHGADRLIRVLVLPLHEPARLIGADRQNGEAEAAM